MKIRMGRADALRIGYASLHGLFGLAYLLGTGLSLGALYQTGYGSSFAGGDYYLLTTALPQAAMPCVLAIAPGALAVAAGRNGATLGRLACGLDAMLAFAGVGAAIGYSSPSAAVASALLAAAAALGARCWPFGLGSEALTEGGEQG